MKTQEEIVIYAVDYAKSIGNEDGTAAFDYAKGYNQCQKDLSNSWTKGCECESSIGQTWCCNQCGLPYDTRKSYKKYTEADIRKAIELARETESVRRGALSEDWDDVEKYDEMDIIYLLNKQD